jgi:hypothetical protein
MSRDGPSPIQLKAWTLPLIVAVLAVPIVAGFWVAGPPLGLAVGFIAAATLVLIAVRARPVEPIEAPGTNDARQHLLVVLSHELDDPAGVEYVADDVIARADSEVRLLAPAKSGLLDRWASDVDEARKEAQRKLVLSAASLGAAQVPSRGAIGDENIVHAVEDELRSFPADEVILVTGSDEKDPEGAAAARELSGRLRVLFSRLVVDHGEGQHRIRPEAGTSRL